MNRDVSDDCFLGYHCFDCDSRCLCVGRLQVKDTNTGIFFQHVEQMFEYKSTVHYKCVPVQEKKTTHVFQRSKHTNQNIHLYAQCCEWFVLNWGCHRCCLHCCSRHTVVWIEKKGWVISPSMIFWIVSQKKIFNRKKIFEYMFRICPFICGKYFFFIFVERKKKAQIINILLLLR